ncbi:TyrR/PhhR family helix-turn-helix DNA-binding protein [Brevibacillus centrosporus]|uniref:TyrR/PhhR family helix-turn-helix DNA-binding protein n=1 Tax=Brevibacillus centrosporus TaxID=54910 RepID=UPI003D239185
MKPCHKRVKARLSFFIECDHFTIQDDISYRHAKLCFRVLRKRYPIEFKQQLIQEAQEAGNASHRRDLPDRIRNEQLGQISSLHALPANQTLTEYLNQIEREIIEEAYRQLQSTRKAAARLGVTQAYIARRFKKYKLKVVEEKDLTTME